MKQLLSRVAFHYRKLRDDGGVKVKIPVLYTELNLEPASLDISDITFRSFVERIEGKKIAYVKFNGVFKEGSQGNDDGLFMRWKFNEAIKVLAPEGMIIDLSELEYTWGDSLKNLSF